MSTTLSKESIRFPKKYMDTYPELKEFIDDLGFVNSEEDESGIIIFWDNDPDDITCFDEVIEFLENNRLPYDCWIPFGDCFSKLFYRPEIRDKAFELSDDEEIMIPASALKNLLKDNDEDIGYRFTEFLNKNVPDLPPIETYVLSNFFVCEDD